MSEQINFHQLIDLAFGSGEGSLNVKYLHALMHGMVQRMCVNNIRIELKGGTFTEVDELLNEMEPHNCIEIVEYEAQKNDCTGKYDKKKKLKKQRGCVDTVMVVKDVNLACNSRPTTCDDSKKGNFVVLFE